MKTEHKVGERQLGIDPKSGKPVFVKIGRYGPIVQIGQGLTEDMTVYADKGYDSAGNRQGNMILPSFIFTC